MIVLIALPVVLVVHRFETNLCSRRGRHHIECVAVLWLVRLARLRTILGTGVLYKQDDVVNDWMIRDNTRSGLQARLC